MMVPKRLYNSLVETSPKNLGLYLVDQLSFKLRFLKIFEKKISKCVHYIPIATSICLIPTSNRLQNLYSSKTSIRCTDI